MNEAATTVADLTNFYVGRALENIIDKIPDEQEQELFLDALKTVTGEESSPLLTQTFLSDRLSKNLIEDAREIATQYAEDTLKKVARKLPKGVGKDYVEETLLDLSRNGIAEICDGADMDSVLSSIETQLSGHTKKFLKEQSAKVGVSLVDSIADGFKDKGRGKGRTSKNRSIKKISGSIKFHLAQEISANIDELWSGNKDLPTALQDVALGVGENVAVDFAEKKAREFADDAIKSVANTAEKELINKIGDKAIKRTAKDALKNFNSLDKVLQHTELLELGKKFLNGEVSRADLMQMAVDKASTAVSEIVGDIAAGAAALLPGGAAAAPAIKAAAGYIAGCVFREMFAPFINAAREAKIAKQRYEDMHEIYEAAIKQMQEQRRLFEQETEKLFSRRDNVIAQSFTSLNGAIASNDVNAASVALDGLSKEFGGKNKLTTFEEFDDFILNGDEEITW